MQKWWYLSQTVRRKKIATTLLSYLHKMQSFRFNHRFNSRSKLLASQKKTNQRHLLKQIRTYPTNSQVKIIQSIQLKTQLRHLRNVQISPNNKCSSHNPKLNFNPAYRQMMKAILSPGSLQLETIPFFPRIISNLSYRRVLKLSFYQRNQLSLRAFCRELNRMNQTKAITHLYHKLKS